MQRTNICKHRTAARTQGRLLASLAVLALLCAQDCAAADSTAGAAGAARDSRQPSEPEPEQAQQAIEILRAKQPEKPKIKLIIGAVHDDADGTRTDNAPYNFTYQTPQEVEQWNWWKFQAIGDGFTRIAAPGKSEQVGVADAKFNLFHGLPHDLMAGVGMNVPTHGAVGSTKPAERVQLLWMPTINKKWSAIAIATALHSPASKAGQSDFAQAGYLELDYNIDANNTLLVDVDRNVRRGTASTSTLSVEWDFPLKGKFGGQAIASKGLSPGARHTGVEVDLVIRF